MPIPHLHYGPSFIILLLGYTAISYNWCEKLISNINT